jgi:hypothetical protein
MCEKSIERESCEGLQFVCCFTVGESLQILVGSLWPWFMPISCLLHSLAGADNCRYSMSCPSRLSEGWHVIYQMSPTGHQRWEGRQTVGSIALDLRARHNGRRFVSRRLIVSKYTRATNGQHASPLCNTVKRRPKYEKHRQCHVVTDVDQRSFGPRSQRRKIKIRGFGLGEDKLILCTWHLGIT